MKEEGLRGAGIWTGWLVALALLVLTSGCGGRGSDLNAAVVLLPEWNAASASQIVADVRGTPPPPAQGSAEDMDDKAAATAAASLDPPFAREFDRGATAAWNEIARNAVSSAKLDPLIASRLYALVSIAQHDAARSAMRQQAAFRRPSPYRTLPNLLKRTAAPDVEYSYPSLDASIGSASATVISALVPTASSFVNDMLSAQKRCCLAGGIAYPSDVSAGESLGREIAVAVIQSFADDGSDAVWAGTIPTGEGIWKSQDAAGRPPIRPLWDQVHLILGEPSTDPPAPPAFGSPEFVSALKEVRKYSDGRTSEQLLTARKWAYSGGTPTPPGAWNEIACQLFSEIPRTADSEIRNARVLAAMNIAMLDAGILCWRAKFTYWLLRPNQADPAITHAIVLPNHPSYPSGHSSFSGAAALVLAKALPSRAGNFQNLAEEASFSRILAGVHYSFDCEQGLILGRDRGQRATDELFLRPQ